MAKFITLGNLATFKTKYDTIIENKHTEAMNAADAANTAATEAQSTANAKYSKPSGGIPKSDLASGVQTSLGKADTALQSHQTITTGSTNGTISVGGKDVAVRNLGIMAFKSNISKSDVRLGNVENQTMDRVPTNNSDNYVTSGGVKDYVDSAIASVRSLQCVKLADGEFLPTADSDTMGKIYLVPHTHDDDNNTDSSAQNFYDEYITICTYSNDENPQENEYTWEKIGNTDIDLSDYVNYVKTSGAPLGVFTAVIKGGNALIFTVTNLATSAPTASGNAVAFIDSISQNERGQITATKKTVSSASTSAAGLMSAADKTKLDGITEATTTEIEALFS